MTFKKFKANQIFTGVQLLPNNYVLITDENGCVQNIVDEKDAGDEVQLFEGILTPGFINAHCHLELSHLKNCIPQHTGLTNFIVEILQKRNATEFHILQQIEAAENEMLANGIVAVGDICNTTFTLAQKKLNKLYYYNFIEVSGWHPSIATTRYNNALSNLQQFSTLPITHHRSSLVPHAPYSVSNELWKLLHPNFHQKAITIHNQESLEEDKLFKNNTGNFVSMYQQLGISHNHFIPTATSSIQSYLPQINNAHQLILVHNTFSSHNDIIAVNHQLQNAFWCICINANLYIENSLPPLETLQKNNCSIVIGTDSLASNTALSVLHEIKTIRYHFPSISLPKILQWATLNGAIALQLQDKLGSFEKGKTPGINCIDENLQQVKKIL